MLCCVEGFVGTVGATLFLSSSAVKIKKLANFFRFRNCVWNQFSQHVGWMVMLAMRGSLYAAKPPSLGGKDSNQFSGPLFIYVVLPMTGEPLPQTTKGTLAFWGSKTVWIMDMLKL